jgi:hypothetical protein
LGAAGLLFLAGVHANWAAGSAWPAADRVRLARAVIGSDELPGAAPCLTVAALLLLASAFAWGWPRQGSAVQRIGAGGVTAVLLARGLAGFAGVLPQERSEIFARWNRRAYSPLCLLLGALVAAAAR